MNIGIIKTYGDQLIQKELLEIMKGMKDKGIEITCESVKLVDDSYTTKEIEDALEVFKN